MIDLNETDPDVPYHPIWSPPPRKYGVRLPPGFNGSQQEIIDDLFEMTSATIQENQLYYGFTVTLERSPLGEWRYTILPKEKYNG